MAGRSWPISHIAFHFLKTCKRTGARALFRNGQSGEAIVAEMGAPRVPLVEDEYLISAMVAEILAEHGFEVHVATNAKDALQHLTCGAPCDVLFTDINLPGGVDGA